MSRIDSGPPSPGTGTARPVRWGREVAAVSALFAVGLAVVLHPLYSDPAGMTFAWNTGPKAADLNLVMWILSWDWHALTSDPLHLLDANIFYPTPRMLLGAEHMLGYLPIFGPVYGSSGNPVLAFNVTILTVLVGAGTGVYALLRHWGVSWSGALFGGFVFAFSPAQMGTLGELQLLGIALAPLGLIFIDRTLMEGRLATALICSLAVAWLSMCSVYLAFIGAAGFAAYTISVVVPMRSEIAPKGVVLLGVAVLLAAVAFGAFHLPYATRVESGAIQDYRSSGKLVAFANRPLANFTVSPRTLRTGNPKALRGKNFYLGIVPLIAVAGCLLRRREARWAVWGAGAIMMTGYVLSLGVKAPFAGEPRTLPYAYLVEWVPGFSSMRVPSRFGALALLGFSALAGVGLGRWLALLSAASWTHVVRGAVLVAAIFGTAYEYDLWAIAPPVAKRPAALSELPAVYRFLRSIPPGPMVEVPVSAWILPRRVRGSEAMFASTFHWFPILDGYTGYMPETAAFVDSLLVDLPDSETLNLVQRTTGLRYLLLHRARLAEAAQVKWMRLSGAQQLFRDHEHILLALRSGPEPDLLQPLIAPGPRLTTLTGTPLRTLRREDQQVEILPVQDVHVGLIKMVGEVTVAVENTSSVTWPTLAPLDAPVVRLVSELECPGVRPVRKQFGLSRDVAPGETRKVKMLLPFRLKRRDRVCELTLGLSQGGEWFPTRRTVELRIPAVSAKSKGRAP